METDVCIQTLAQLTGGEEWRLNLVQDRPYPLLIWVTRGQGRLLLNGTRRGVGAHNAIFIPAGHIFALDLGRQGLGQAVILPVSSDLRLPEVPRHLRVRDVDAQNELTGFIDAALREQSQDRALKQDALEAHVALMSVWIRRLITEEEHLPSPKNAAAKLSARYCAMVTDHYATGATMGQYALGLEVTPTHLSRSVREATGMTAADLLAQRLLYEARDLLSSTRHPVKHIAKHLGFGSPAYFSRFVTRHCGQSPQALRKAASSKT